MSGGYFDYEKYDLHNAACDIDTLIEVNERGFTKPVIKEFKKALECLRKTTVYMERIDYLVCGDHAEGSFIELLSEELKEVAKRCKK